MAATLFKKNKSGFTITELLVVISIVSLLSVVILVNYRTGDTQFALQRSAHRLAQDIRRAQNMSMATQEFRGEVPGGYGIYFNLNDPGEYILFADLDGNRVYDPGEEVEVLELERGIVIIELSPSKPLSVFFSPPDPTVTISGIIQNEATIYLNYVGGPGKTVKVNKAGLIETK